MNYYPMYPGDFMRDTAHLSAAEVGVYMRLLNHYYSTERPLPPDAETLNRIGARGPEEEKIVRRIVAEFFPMNGDGGRHNNRADKEILKWKSKSKGGQARAAKLSPAERSAIARDGAAKRHGR